MTFGGRWHIDGLQLEKSGRYDHLLVATDVATKYVVLKACQGENARSASNLVIDIAERFGRPIEITTDRGSAFTSNLFMTTLKELGITFKPVAVGQPQADGMVERVNRTLLDIASILCKGKGADWPNHVREIEYALNTRVSSVTGHSPYELVFGRVPPGPTFTDILREEAPDVERGGQEQPFAN